MDPSALIFVALAVAWAVYLIPKALEHHEEGARTRTVERFSATMRVLARREPVNRRTARLVTPGQAAPTPAAAPAAPSAVRSTAPAAARSAEVATPEVTPTAAQARARRTAAARAAKRRLRVVTLLLVANVVVAALAYLAYVEWVWCAVPIGVLVAWLVACRLMVKRERAVRPVRGRLPASPAAPAPRPAARPDRLDETGQVAPVDASDDVDDVDGADEAGRTHEADGADGVDPETRDPESWDPVPVTLPTYVSKSVAPRSVRTIDLDSTGVWSSGRNESDSALARGAEAADAADRAASETSAERRRRATS